MIEKRIEHLEREQKYIQDALKGAATQNVAIWEELQEQAALIKAGGIILNDMIIQFNFIKGVINV